MLPREQLQALVFDFDGTLIASRIDFALMRERVLEQVRAWGLDPIPRAEALVLEVVAWAQEQLAVRSPERAAAYRREAEEVLWEVERPACEVAAPFPGVPEALQRARETGLALGVITRNSYRGVSAVLDRHPLPLSVIITRDDLAEVKPHPRHLLVALEQLGCPPERALLVGDHPTDLQCAQAAGVRGAAVLTTGGDPETFRALGAEAIYPDAATLLRDLLEAPGHDRA